MIKHLGVGVTCRPGGKYSVSLIKPFTYRGKAISTGFCVRREDSFGEAMYVAFLLRRFLGLGKKKIEVMNPYNLLLPLSEWQDSIRLVTSPRPGEARAKR